MPSSRRVLSVSWQPCSSYGCQCSTESRRLKGYETLASDYATAYIYFAVGPTRKIGIAQWNAVDRAIEVVRDTFFG